jgi:hypothetical protein
MAYLDLPGIYGQIEAIKAAQQGQQMREMQMQQQQQEQARQGQLRDLITNYAQQVPGEQGPETPWSGAGRMGDLLTKAAAIEPQYLPQAYQAQQQAAQQERDYRLGQQGRQAITEVAKQISGMEQYAPILAGMPTDKAASLFAQIQKQQAEKAITPYQQEQLNLGRQKLEEAKSQFSRGLKAKEDIINLKAKIPEKLSPTAQKELFEADDMVNAGQNVVTLLNQAKGLNEIAYSGVGAKQRALVASNMPGMFGGGSKEANATIDMDNIMTSQALESLKSVFGGMPTEGERKILLDVQASVDKTPQQRETIINRAIDAANRRINLNKEKASSLRKGTYFREAADQQDVQVPTIKVDW